MVGAKYTGVLQLLPKSEVDDAFFAKNIKVVADVICDALVYFTLRSKEKTADAVKSGSQGSEGK